MEEQFQSMQRVQVIVSELQSMRQVLECAICLELFKQAVTINCGHKFCKACITRHIGTSRDERYCPVCNTKITKRSSHKEGSRLLELCVEKFNKLREAVHLDTGINESDYYQRKIDSKEGVCKEKNSVKRKISLNSSVNKNQTQPLKSKGAKGERNSSNARYLNDEQIDSYNMSKSKVESWLGVTPNTSLNYNESNKQSNLLDSVETYRKGSNHYSKSQNSSREYTTAKQSKSKKSNTSLENKPVQISKISPKAANFSQSNDDHWRRVKKVGKEMKANTLKTLHVSRTKANTSIYLDDTVPIDITNCHSINNDKEELVTIDLRKDSTSQRARRGRRRANYSNSRVTPSKEDREILNTSEQCSQQYGSDLQSDGNITFSQMDNEKLSNIIGADLSETQRPIVSDCQTDTVISQSQTRSRISLRLSTTKAAGNKAIECPIDTSNTAVTSTEQATNQSPFKLSNNSQKDNEVKQLSDNAMAIAETRKILNPDIDTYVDSENLASNNQIPSTLANVKNVPLQKLNFQKACTPQKPLKLKGKTAKFLKLGRICKSYKVPFYYHGLLRDKKLAEPFTVNKNCLRPSLKSILQVENWNSKDEKHSGSNIQTQEIKLLSPEKDSQLQFLSTTPKRKSPKHAVTHIRDDTEKFINIEENKKINNELNVSHKRHLIFPSNNQNNEEMKSSNAEVERQVNGPSELPRNDSSEKVISSSEITNDFISKTIGCNLNHLEKMDIADEECEKVTITSTSSINTPRSNKKIPKPISSQSTETSNTTRNRSSSCSSSSSNSSNSSGTSSQSSLTVKPTNKNKRILSDESEEEEEKQVNGWQKEKQPLNKKPKIIERTKDIPLDFVADSDEDNTLTNENSSKITDAVIDNKAGKDDDANMLDSTNENNVQQEPAFVGSEDIFDSDQPLHKKDLNLPVHNDEYLDDLLNVLPENHSNSTKDQNQSPISLSNKTLGDVTKVSYQLRPIDDSLMNITEDQMNLKRIEKDLLGTNINSEGKNNSLSDEEDVIENTLEENPMNSNKPKPSDVVLQNKKRMQTNSDISNLEELETENIEATPTAKNRRSAYYMPTPQISSQLSEITSVQGTMEPPNLIPAITPVRHRRSYPLSHSTPACQQTPRNERGVTPESIKKKLCLVSSGLRKDEVAKIQRFAEIFHGIYKSNFDEDVTHVVIKTTKNNKPVKTFKYIQGIAYQKYVLSFTWITDCLEANKLLDEDRYEFFDTVPTKCGSRKSRTREKELFEQFSFCFIGSSNDYPFSIDEMKKVLVHNGAKIVSNIAELKSQKTKFKLIIKGENEDLTEEEDNRMKSNGLICIAYEWIIDSFSAYEIKSLCNYLYNVEPIEALQLGIPAEYLQDEYEDDDDESDESQ